MTLTIRPLDINDYDNILVGWWRDWGWEPVEREFLPENGNGGAIVFDGDEPVCAGFIYLTNSRVAWVDWIISSKTYRKKPQRTEAIELLIDALTNACALSGYKYTYALIKHQSLIGAYERNGYVKGDVYTSEMIKAL